ncbi:MAG: helix-turn-helix domain-containing protein [Candidatus Nanopelagicales bacterium]|nr:helix-turn-helix domain-containing protein [Candidatus Nanopelagicales bacterium]MDZ4249089.1 helix-turn-helix domain-containing protein [Candidatus Nanopelagicales bacterium]
MSTEASQTLDRGLQVLEVLADHPAGLNITQVAAQLGISRTSVYRLVTTLQQHGFVRRSQDRRCRLGMAALALARPLQPLVRDAAVPVLRRLADQVSATVHLTLVDGSEAQAVAVVEPARSETFAPQRVGARAPLDRGLAGRAAVATRAPGRQMEPGWVVSGGDPSRGGYAVAAPVLGVIGLEASVGVTATTELDSSFVGPRVVAAASEIARLLS